MMKSRRSFALVLVLALVIGAGTVVPASRTASAAAPTAAPTAELWREVEETSLGRMASIDRVVAPRAYKLFQLDEAALATVLDRAPLEFTEAARAAAPLELPIPMPDGSLQRFRIQESPVMEPELAARFPSIRTYIAQGIDDPAATVRFDCTPLGFHAQILSPSGAVYVDPYYKGNTSLYATYYKRDAAREKAVEFRCLVEGRDGASAERVAAPAAVSGSSLRTYRLALGNTIEYASAVCTNNGVPLTTENVFAAMVTSVNRVTGIYETEVAVRLTLVANNTALVNTTSDTYTNNSGSTMLSQNQTRCDSVIGSANYDIGHVFSTGGGGIAGLGVVCRAGLEARGVTGLDDPRGDVFDVDYVAHEMGHQFDGDHTFNGCGSQRNASTAYEPGSGSTIQAYAGICGSTNLQSNSDPYFHGISFDQIVAYTTTGLGNCPAPTSTGNTAPTVDAGAAYTIPRSTPFELTASGFDPDGDALTYCWEEFDLGPEHTTNTDNGSSPILRSFLPKASPTRVFPQIPRLINNTSAFGEVLPSTNRTMTFRCTVRDNRAGGGGVANDSTTVTSTTTAGPFLVTSPNTAVTLAGGSSQNITWNVAGTNAGAVNTQNVMIMLSVDGGNTFPIVLRASTPNDGSESITIPNVPTTTARIKVKGAGNIFFDISNANFTITSAVTGGDSIATYVAPTGTFFLRNANSSGPASADFRYGPMASTLIPLMGDWNGDHVDTPGLYNPATGSFMLKNTSGPGAADMNFRFGTGGAHIVPLRGDWNGDGIDTIGIYNRTTGVFFLKNSNSSGPADLSFRFGPMASTFVPITGDWNGDVYDTIGLYNPSLATFLLRNSNTSGPAEVSFVFGGANQTPIVGDWNQDGRDTIGIYNASSTFFIRNSNTAGGADTSFGFGSAGSLPLTGDWDGL